MEEKKEILEKIPQEYIHISTLTEEEREKRRIRNKKRRKQFAVTRRNLNKKTRARYSKKMRLQEEKRVGK